MIRLYSTFVFLLLSTVILAGPTLPQDSRPILLLYAFDEEGVNLGQQMIVTDTDTVLGRVVLVGTLAGKQIVLAETGVGLNNAAMTAQAMIDRYQPRIVLLSGIAGAVDTTVHIGDICVPERWAQHDYGYIGEKGFEWKGVWAFNPDVDSLGRFTAFPADTGLLGAVEDMNQDSLALENIGSRRPRVIIGGVGVTGNQFIDSQEKREWLTATFHPFVTDMESSAVAQVCTVNDLPFLIFRSASDLAGGSGSATARGEMDQFFKIAAQNSAAVVIGFLKSLKTAN